MTPTRVLPGVFDLLLPPEGQSGFARDIELLLNTRGRTLPPDHPRADDTTGEGFGTHALDLTSAAEPGDLKKLGRQIEVQLQQFERRLLEPQVVVTADRTIRIDGAVRVRVKTTLAGLHRRQVEERAVAFTAVLGSSGFYTVKEVSP